MSKGRAALTENSRVPLGAVSENRSAQVRSHLRPRRETPETRRGNSPQCPHKAGNDCHPHQPEGESLIILGPSGKILKGVCISGGDK